MKAETIYKEQENELKKEVEFLKAETWLIRINDRTFNASLSTIQIVADDDSSMTILLFFPIQTKKNERSEPL